jgi:hypothetical protein
MERAEEDSALKEMERLSDGALKGMERLLMVLSKDGETYEWCSQKWRDLIRGSLRGSLRSLSIATNL